MAINFDDLLASIHNGNGQSPIVSDSEQAITIDAEKRTFIVPSGLNTRIGITNDFNANELTFICPKIIDGHDVSQCSHKIIKWYNTNSLIVGSDSLSFETIEDKLKMKWIVPHKALTKEGSLQLAICFCDIAENEVVYKWNSEICNAFSVAKGLDNVPIYGGTLSRIVTIDMYNRTLILPPYFNTTIANVGDSGIGQMTFRINRFYDNIDFAKAKLMIRWTNAKKIVGKTTLYSSTIVEGLTGDIQDDWLEFDWDLPFELVENQGTIEIIITLFLLSEEDENTYIWNSNPFKEFKIGEGTLPDFAQPDSPELGLNIVPTEILNNLLFAEYGYTHSEEGGE